MYFIKNLFYYIFFKLVFISFIFIIGCSSSAQNDQNHLKKEVILKEKYFSKVYANYLSGLSANYNYDFGLAAEYALKALKERPTNTELLSFAFKMLIFSGQLDKAAEISSRLEFYGGSKDPMNLWPAILVELRHKDYNSANQLLKNLGLDEHEKFFTSILKSWHFAILDQEAKSITQINSLLEEKYLYPNISPIQIEIQKLYLLTYLKNYDEIRALITNIRKKSYKIPIKYLLSISQILYFLDEKNSAKELLNQDLPNNYDINAAIAFLSENKLITPNKALSIALSDTGSILAKRRGWFYALPFLRMSLYLNDQNFNSKLLLSSILQSMKRYNEALSLFNNKNNVYFPIISIEKAYLYEDLNNYEKVEEILNELSRHPNFTKLAKVKLSNHYIRRKMYEKALFICNELLKTKNPDNEVYYYRALALVSIKKWDEALDALDELIKKIPDNPSVMNFVGYTYVDRNIKLEQGLNLIKKAIDIEPNNGFYIDSLGWAYFRMGEFDKAVVYIEKSVELEPLEAEITDHLGDVYFQLGRTKEALVQWKRALSLNPPEDYGEIIKRKILDNEIN